MNQEITGTHDSETSSSQVAVLDATEQAIMDSILDAYSGILNLGLKANQGELTAAVHVLQGFVAQHMLHRIAPTQWGSWYQEAGK